MNIRKAISNDASALVEFNQAMAIETEGKQLSAGVLTAGVKAVLSDPGKGFYIVAEDSQTIAGGLMVTFEWSDWRNAWFWWIQSVYIIPAYRGKSIYSLLYQKVKELSDEQNDVCGFRLYVEKDNTHAQRVYEKVGMSASHYQMFEEMK